MGEWEKDGECDDNSSSFFFHFLVLRLLTVRQKELPVVEASTAKGSKLSTFNSRQSAIK